VLLDIGSDDLGLPVRVEIARMQTLAEPVVQPRAGICLIVASSAKVDPS
jgi:hypothetical protein